MQLNFTRATSLLTDALLALTFFLNLVSAGEREKSSRNTFQHANARQAAQLVTRTNIVALDIRTPGEFASGPIVGATNIDFLAGEFAEKPGKLDREKTYLMHCGTGWRSTNCLPQLGKLGFTNVVHLDGGFKAWQPAGNLVIKR